MEFPEPVIDLAIEPKTKAGQEKMAIGLAKLAEEDPTFRTYTDQETGQTIIAGMGELHLEVIVDRLLREFKVEANVGKPQVAYKETIRKLADVDHKYARQSGGKGQYGHVKIKVEPNNSGKGYEFVNAIVGGAIPKEYIGPIDKVSRALCRPVFWLATRWLMSKSPCTTALIMRSTPLRWRLRSVRPWPLKRLAARLTPAS